MARRRAQPKPDLTTLANTIYSLSYNDMMTLARDLSEAISESDVWPRGCHTQEDFAQLLMGWAESQPYE